MKIKYGNKEGKYFTQWRFDHLKSLLEDITSVHKLNAVNPSIWYDSDNDYHMLEFELFGKPISIRYYKVFGLNGRTWPHHYQSGLVGYLKKLGS